MAKSSNRGLWIGISIIAIAGVSYFVYKKFFKSSSKDQKDCEDKGGTWNAETKSCDLPVESNTSNPNSSPANTNIKTGKNNIDTIIDRLAASGKKGKVAKSKDGRYYIQLAEPLIPVGKNNKIQFYDNDKFWIGTDKGKEISRGIYADGGRTMVVTSGKNKGINATTNSLYDTIKKILG